MTTVLVHGSPETSRIWGGVRAHIEGDHVALALPGFGCPRPDGFDATMDGYADWLLDEIDRIDEPVDLVGHDWGGILTTRVATTAPDRIRSWVSDAVTVVDPDFAWHDFAKIWQTPGEGERFWNGLLEAPSEDTVALLTSLGVPETDAPWMVEALDATMVGCILDLYRSATDIGSEWGYTGSVDTPGLVIVGAADAFGDEVRSRVVADRLGAEFVALQGLGHWWLLQDPAAGAAALNAFWTKLAR